VHHPHKDLTPSIRPTRFGFYVGGGELRRAVVEYEEEFGGSNVKRRLILPADDLVAEERSAWRALREEAKGSPGRIISGTYAAKANSGAEAPCLALTDGPASRVVKEQRSPPRIGHKSSSSAQTPRNRLQTAVMRKASRERERAPDSA
jgi:hypothetical protein